MTPPCAISPVETRVLLSVLRVSRRDGVVEVRSLMTESGVSDFVDMHWHLYELVRARLVRWVGPGVLRPLVAPVAVLDAR
jgi:hypothetical protein